MATVPEVAPRPLPGARQESLASPALFAGGGESLDKIGTGATKLGAEVLDIAGKIQHEEDLTTVQQADATYKDAALKFQLDAKEKRRGSSAYGVAADYDTFHKKLTEEIGKGFKNDAQRRAFGVLSSRTRQAMYGDLATYEMGQRREANTQAHEALIDKSISLGAIAATDGLAEEQLNTIRAGTAAYAKQNGLEPEVADRLLMRYTTAFHTQRIQQLGISNPKTALDYFNANRGEIDGKLHAELEAKVKTVAADAKGEEAVASVMSAMGPLHDRSPFELDKMEERIRDLLKGDEAALKAGMAKIKERYSAFNISRKERDEEVKAKVHRMMLSGRSFTEIERTPEFKALDTDTALQIRTTVKNWAAADESRAAARESRAFTAESREIARQTRAGQAAYLLYSNPDTLRGMTENQVFNLLPSLGPEHTTHLLQQHRQITKSADAMRAASIDNDSFNQVAQDLGLKPFDPHKSEDERAALGALKFRVERVIAAEQTARKKALTEEEKLGIFRREMSKTVMYDSPWYEFGFDRPRPAIAMSAKDLEKVIVPEADRISIVAEYKKRGKPQPTQREIVDLYLRGQGHVWPGR